MRQPDSQLDSASSDQVSSDQAGPDLARPDKGRPDRARPDRARPDQVGPAGDLPPVKAVTVGRVAALGGIGFLVASLASDLVIGALPGPDTPAPQLVTFYGA